MTIPLEVPSASRARRRLRLLGLVLVGVLLLAWSPYRVAVVVGESMRPTFASGDLLLVDRQAYLDTEPARGDIVLVRARDEILLKRVVGLPGERVGINDGALYVNGQLAAEEHPIKPGSLEIGEGRLFDGKFALVGDNRALPPHQTVHLVVTKEQIRGKIIGAFRWRRTRRS
ncbi:MAG: signal peptidase I [Verrucomicrobiota bacterium]